MIIDTLFQITFTIFFLIIPAVPKYIIFSAYMRGRDGAYLKRSTLSTAITLSCFAQVAAYYAFFMAFPALSSHVLILISAAVSLGADMMIARLMFKGWQSLSQDDVRIVAIASAISTTVFLYFITELPITKEVSSIIPAIAISIPLLVLGFGKVKDGNPNVQLLVASAIAAWVGLSSLIYTGRVLSLEIASGILGYEAAYNAYLFILITIMAISTFRLSMMEYREKAAAKEPAHHGKARGKS